MEQDPIGNDARRARRERLLGADAQCFLCCFAKPEALLGVRRSLLEKHHVVGRANGPKLTVLLCLNCHAVMTEKYRTHGVPMRPGNILEQVIAGLRAFGAFLPSAGETCFRLATALQRFLAALDAKYPEWRDMPEAK